MGHGLLQKYMKKFVATPKDNHGGFMVERFNAQKGDYELFCPLENAVISEIEAKSLAAFMNYLFEE